MGGKTGNTEYEVFDQDNSGNVVVGGDSSDYQVVQVVSNPSPTRAFALFISNNVKQAGIITWAI